MTNTQDIPTLDEIQRAAVRIAPWVHRTPLLGSRQLDALTGCHLSCKCENLQRAGAFKARGAANAVWSLAAATASNGVATHSSGNHGAALALAAANRGVPAYIVMPDNAPEVKKAAVEAYGASVIYCQPTLAAREVALAQVVRETGAFFIPPYACSEVICGQATVATELLAQLADDPPDVIIAPVGGGGLLSGIALAVSALAPSCVVLGAEPTGADDAHRSLHSGQRVVSHQPETIADGLLTTLGEINFSIIRERVEDILLVNDQQIVEAMQLVWTRMKLVIEPSAAVPLAAVLAHRERFLGRHVALVFSGGNVDLQKLPW